MKISVRVTKHETPNSGTRTWGGGRGGGRGFGDWVMGMSGALGGMSTGCYAKCWQIELQ